MMEKLKNEVLKKQDKKDVLRLCYFLESLLRLSPLPLHEALSPISLKSPLTNSKKLRYNLSTILSQKEEL